MSRERKRIYKLYKRHHLIILFLLSYLLFSILLSKNIGVAWDESEIYARGNLLLNYFLGKIGFDTYLADTYGLYYNHLYSLVLNLINTKGTYGIFHLLNMLFAVFMYISSYLLFYSIYKNPRYAILGPVLLFLTPRLTGHLPINPKDASFAIVYFMSLSAIVLTNDLKNKYLKIILLGLLFGLTISSRLVGFNIFIVYVFYRLLKSTQAKKLKSDIFDIVLEILIIFALSNLILVITWPYLASNYFVKIIELFSLSKNYPWNGSVLFNGQYIISTELPISYLPTWLLITTPIYIIVLLVLGLLVVKRLINNDISIVFLFAVFINFVLYFTLKPVIYDGLRHYLFLLPIITTISTVILVEFIKLNKYKKFKLVLFAFIIINIVLVLRTSIKLFPYNYVYFNEIIGGLPGAYQKYETDYMGVSHKEGVNWLLNSLPKESDKVWVMTCGHPESGIYYLKNDKRVRWTNEIGVADYLVCYTRFEQHLIVPQTKTIHTISRDGVPLNYIKKVN